MGERQTEKEVDMIDGIESLFQMIAESIQDAIPENWDTATMDVIFYPGSSIYLGEYTRKADGAPRSFGTTKSGERAFRELRNKFKESGKQLWGQAYFELHSDGKFDMKWGYDDCDENGDTRFDEEKEFKRNEERFKRLTSA
jgi:hypothetical protein